MRQVCKKNGKWILVYVLGMAIFSALLALHNISLGEIIYGDLLCLFLLFLVLGFEWFAFRERHNRLTWLLHSIQIAVENLPEPGDFIEEDYQELLQLVHADKMAILNQSSVRERDMKEYYSMWVHQVKTPISAMRLLLQTSEEDTSELEGELFHIEQYVEMALQYIRLDSTTNDLVIQTESLDPLIRESIRKYARQFIGKKLRLSYEGTDLLAITDKKWLQFVLEQLFANAIKYTTTGGLSIQAAKRKQETDDGIIKERVVINITDTGMGIAPEDLPRVCEKGYTGYNGHSNQDSSGIGLYLCKRMLTKLGHELEITSTLGEGTCVSILL